MRLVNRLKKEWGRPINHLSVILPFWVGLWFVWIRHPNTVLVSGYGWPNAFRNAWLIAEGQTRHYDYFRDPLYSVLLNALSTLTDSYAISAVVLGWGITIGTWFFMCRIARMVSGNAGQWWLLYALTQAPLLQSMMVQANTYPLSAMTMLAAVWGILRHIRRPSAQHYIVAVGLLGMAICADGRALGLVPFGLWGFWRKGGTWQRRLRRLAFGVLLIYLLPLLLDWWCGLEAEKLAAHHIGMIYDFQQGVVQRWATVGTDLRMGALCQDLQAGDFLTLSFLSTDCARAVLTHNLYERWPLVLNFPWWQLGLGAGISVLLCRGTVRWGLLIAAIGIWLASTWTVMPPRYLLQIGPFMIILSMVGLGRLTRGLSKTTQLVMGLILFAFGFSKQVNGLPLVQEQAMYIEDWDSIAEAIPERTVGVTDCTATGLGLALYPRLPLLVRPERDAVFAEARCNSVSMQNTILVTTDLEEDIDIIWSGYLGFQYTYLGALR